MESTITKMKEVEIHEEKAKRTKEEAAMADQDILAKIEDLGQMIKSAQESNDKVISFWCSSFFFGRFITIQIESNTVHMLAASWRS